MNGNDLLAQIENENPKLGIYLRNYLIPTIQPRGRAGQVLATPPDAVGNASLRNLSDLVNNSNPPSAAYVGTNKSGQLVSAPTPQSGITQLTGDVTAGPGSGSVAAQVVATHLAAPLPVNQGGSGTATPSLVAGSNVTVSGTWPNQTVAASGGGGGGGYITPPPSSSSSTGTAGQYSFDSDGAHAYFCFAANKWAKVSLINFWSNPPVTDGLLMYFDASQYSYASGSPARELFDLSGNGFNALSSAGATFQTNQINGQAALSFPGNSNGRYTLANTSVLLNATVFVVAKAAASAILYFLSGPSSSLGVRFTNSGSGVAGQMTTETIANIGISTTVIPLNTFAQMNATLSSAGVWAFRVAQAAAGNGTYTGTMPSAANSLLGYFGGGGFDYNGEIAMMLVYSRVLSGAEIASVESWLNGKYGV